MTRWLAPAVLVLTVGLVALIRPTPAADAPKVSPRADALDLLILGDQPARLELRVEIDGRPVPAVWDDTFARLLEYFDRNGDSVLDRAEAGRLPSAFALRQVLWGQILPTPGAPPAFAYLDLNADGRVAADELADYYRRAGLGGVLVSTGKPVASGRLTDSLLKHLDADKDGRVSEAEWKAAQVSLRELDKNADELIGPGELVEKTVYPGTTAATLYPAPTPADPSDSGNDVPPFVVLPLRTADTHWVGAVAARSEKRTVRAFKADALAGVRKAPPAAAWDIRLGARKKDSAPLQAADGKPPSDARLRFSAAGVRLVLRADEGKLKEQVAAAGKRFAAQFAECDANADGTLDEKEIAAPKAVLFKQMALAADRDCDGKLTEKELAGWLALQEQVAKGHVLVSVLDHGAGLFEFLDADHDGSLSVRELRSAWDRLKASGCVPDGVFDRAKLPRQLVAAVSHGHPLTSLGRPVRPGPDWFVAMDRNGDGDVSRREFTGPADVFDKLDADDDGLLSADEAVKAAGK